jgi:hypothetical protein
VIFSSCVSIRVSSSASFAASSLCVANIWRKRTKAGSHGQCFPDRGFSFHQRSLSAPIVNTLLTA